MVFQYKYVVRKPWATVNDDIGNCFNSRVDRG